jgi:hypothetical protein
MPQHGLVTAEALPRVSGRHRNHALAALRRERAIQLRASGLTFSAIAQEMGYASKGTVHHIVTKAMNEHVVEAVTDRRLLEGARLDALQAAIWHRAMAGDVRACWEARAIILARIKLFGLDKNEATSVIPRTAVVEPTVENLEAFIQGLGGDLGCNVQQATADRGLS